MANSNAKCRPRAILKDILWLNREAIIWVQVRRYLVLSKSFIKIQQLNNRLFCAACIKYPHRSTLFISFNHFQYISKFSQMIKFCLFFFLLFFRSSKLLRAFYVPFLSDQYTVYANYTILKPRKGKQIRKKSGGQHHACGPKGQPSC